MIDLYLQTTAGPVWPYTDQQLRFDNPRLSFSLELPDAELAALREMPNPILVWRPRASACPPATREQRWIEAMPQMVDGEPVQQWVQRPATAEEIIEWDSEGLPPPDWLGFAGWLYTFPPIATAMEAARHSADPQGEPATTGLPAALQEARLNQNYPAWAATWGQFLLASGMGVETLTEIVSTATACHLPAEFIAALQPTPPPGS